MKMMFVSTRYYPYEVGGAEVTVKLLAEGLVRSGESAVVATLAPDGKASERTINGVHVYYIPLFNVFFPHGPQRHSSWRKAIWQIVEAWNPVMARRLMQVVDREAPDLVHIHNVLGFTCAIWPALAQRRLPVLQTLHDHYAACTNSLMYRPASGNCEQHCLRCRLLCAPRLRLSRHVDALTAVSSRLLQRIGPLGAFPERRLTRVIHNCNANPSLAAPRSGPRPNAPLRLGFLGRLEPIKGPQILLEAAHRVGAERVQVFLGGTGSPDYEQALKSRFGPPLATFRGRVTPATFFGDVDLLVAPSLVEEASGRVVHEAFGFGVPVVGVSAGGMPELIQEAKTGFVVPPGDVAALEALLRRLLADPIDWAAMSASCLEAAQRFAFDAVFSEYAVTWKDVLRASTTASRSYSPQPARALVSPSISDA